MREQAYEQIKAANAKLHFEHYTGQHEKQLVFGCPDCISKTQEVTPKKLAKELKLKCGDAIDEIERACEDLEATDAIGYSTEVIAKIKAAITKLDDLLFSE